MGTNSQQELFGADAGIPGNWQVRLLRRCERSNLDLLHELSSIGRTMEDLSYTSDLNNLNSSSCYQSPERFKRPKNGVPVVSLFSGCGGLDLGFEAAGFEQLASVEINKLFCETLRLNRPGWRVIGPPDSKGDVSDRPQIVKDLRSAGLKERFKGVFIGGPPCQPFSVAANQRFSASGKNFKRIGYAHKTNGSLLHDYVHLITYFLPTAFLIENVPGLMDIDNGKQLASVLEQLREAGYKVETPLELNAANYGVPQQRIRLFIIGSRTARKFVPPQKSDQVVSCGAALQNLSPQAPNHEARNHKPESLLRYMRLDFGERDHLGRVDRLDPRIPSKTVIAGGTKGGGRSHLHPHVPRTLTVRECARLQTFPDDFLFQGPVARQFTQVGNAVPPVLAAQLAIAIYGSYFKPQ